MKPLLKTAILKTLLLIFILLFSIILGIYAGFKTTEDYRADSLEVDGLTGDVRVYRDEYGIPTIIAENRNDLFFALGYEYASDRLWQAEFFRALAHGELSTLLGDVQNMTDNDKFLRTLSFKKAAEQSWAKTNPTFRGYVQRYVDGLNQYIEDHENNLPLEFQILWVLAQ